MKKMIFFQFLKTFVQDPINIGAIFPSSNALAEAMIKNILIGPSDSILELGPGTGVFTQKILEKTNLYLGIERNPRFAKLLNKRFPELNIVNGLAEDGYDLYNETGLPSPRMIVCGLPLAIWSKQLQDQIIEVLDNLMEKGSVCRTFQYAHSFMVPPAVRFRNKMNNLFRPYQKSPVILQNFPPAFILTWHRR